MQNFTIHYINLATGKELTEECFAHDTDKLKKDFKETHPGHELLGIRKNRFSVEGKYGVQHKPNKIIKLK